MSSKCTPQPRENRGYSRGFADRYSEERWKVRYKGKEKALRCLCPWGAYLEDCPRDDLPPPPLAVGQEPNESPDATHFVRLWVRAEQVLAVLPTAVLVGAYGAIAFHFLSLGPDWVGFLAGAVPVSGLAAWAFGDSPRS